MVGLVALMAVLFALAYVSFLREEVRARSGETVYDIAWSGSG